MATISQPQINATSQVPTSAAKGIVQPVSGTPPAASDAIREPVIAEESDHSLVHTANTNELGLARHKNFFQPGSPITRIPVELDVAVPVRDFRVRNLLNLLQGQLVETHWSHGDDLPLSSGDVQMAWTEFEVVDTRLAVRITRLA